MRDVYSSAAPLNSGRLGSTSDGVGQGSVDVAYNGIASLQTRQRTTASGSSDKNSGDDGEDSGDGRNSGHVDILTLLHNVTVREVNDDAITRLVAPSKLTPPSRQCKVSSNTDTLTPEDHRSARSLWTTTHHEGDNYSISELSIGVKFIVSKARHVFTILAFKTILY